MSANTFTFVLFYFITIDCTKKEDSCTFSGIKPCQPYIDIRHGEYHILVRYSSLYSNNVV